MELEGVSFKVTAETGQLEQAEAEVRKFSTEAEQAQKTVDKFGNELSKTDKEAGRFIDSAGRMREKTGGYVKTADEATKSTSKLGSELDKTGKSTKSFTNDLAGMDAAALTAVKSMGVLAGAAGGYTIALANNVKEQQAWASAVGVSLQTMQSWGAAAKTVGRDVDFIGDVFKDANEKIGDFVATGGGEAKDVFEQLNIQAAELKNLSPDQQLLRIAEGLDSVQTRGEKLFILESLANDASLLLPLLEDNARGLKDVTDQAERLGVVMSDADASMLREVANEWTALTQSVQGFGNTLATEYAGDVASALNSISGGVQSLTQFIDENSESLRTAGTLLTGAVAGYGAYVTATKAATLATVGFNAALSANPLGLLARGLAVAGGALATYMLTKENATELERDNTNAIYGNINAIALQSKETRESAIASLELKKSQIQTELESRRVEQAAFKQRVAEIAALRDAYGHTAENIELYNQSILNLALTQENSAEVQAQLEQQLADTEDRISQLRDTFTSTVPPARTLDNEIKKQIRSYRELRGVVDPVQRAYNGYYDLVQQIADSSSTAAEKTELMAIAYAYLQDELNGLKPELEDVADEIERQTSQADPYAKAWEEATKRIDDSFAKAWEGAFDSFESFADSIMDSFKTLLANLAHQAISKPILISMGIGGGIGGAGTAAASTGAAGGGFSMSSIGSMFSGNGIGSMISDFGGFVGGSSPLAGTGAGNFISGATANAANVSNLAWGAGGIGGGLLSNALGLSGEYSGITGAAGTAIGGTLLAPVLGPLAPLAGSFLGSALGGLFGNDEPSNMEGRAIIDNLANPSLRISGQTGEKFSQENRDAAANIAGIIQQNILGTIGGLSGQEFGGELIVGLGDRDPFRFRYTDESGQSFGLGRSGSQGISFDERIGANTRDVNEYLETITQFFADQANLDLSVYEQFQNENELLIEAVARISAQMNTMVSAADLLNLSFDGTEEQLMQWSDNIAQAAGGLDVLQAATASYYDNFFTDAEKLEDLTESLTAAFDDLGVALPDTREGFRAIIEGLDLTTESGQEMYAALLQLNPQVAEYINGLEQVGSVMDRLMGRADTALSGVMSAIRAERDALTGRYKSEREAILASQSARQDQLDAERDAFRELERSYSALDRAFGRMNMTDSASVFSRASGATEYLRAALASGGIPTADELEPYLAAAQEPTEELFESFEDYARQFFVAKNLIGELRERAGDQLTTDEKALREAERFYDNQLSALERQYDLDMEALDQQAEEAQSLYDAVTGVNDGILSVVEAIHQLEASLADVLAGTEGSGGTFGSITDQSGSDVRTIDIAGDPIVEAYNRLFGRDPDVAGYRYWAGMIESGAVPAGSLDDFLLGGARGIDVPGFADGGMHSGGIRIVGERGPELEYTGPSRIMNNGDLMDAISSGAETERAVKNMNDDLMSGLRAIEKNTREVKQLQRRWDQQGLPETRDFL